MLKFYNYDIVFQEIPDEVTLAVNITGCPNKCPGCHSPHLCEDIGAPLDEQAVSGLFDKYKSEFTCFCFMGGDINPYEVMRLSQYVKQTFPPVKTAWYSGCEDLPEGFQTTPFDYVKVGEYIEALGGLKSIHTNQHLYKIAPDGTMTDITYKFRQKHL